MRARVRVRVRRVWRRLSLLPLLPLLLRRRRLGVRLRLLRLRLLPHLALQCQLLLLQRLRRYRRDLGDRARGGPGAESRLRVRSLGSGAWA